MGVKTGRSYHVIGAGRRPIGFLLYAADFNRFAADHLAIMQFFQAPDFDRMDRRARQSAINAQVSPRTHHSAGIRLAECPARSSWGNFHLRREHRAEDVEMAVIFAVAGLSRLSQSGACCEGEKSGQD
ncbi:hypothetical protein [Leisingera sp.]|uniref:hypothetical protein n=1 Tax=Leisingera sp. TaxID=1879318 RepID=UPI002B271737|nr:hypothetical protein [Leisingera sp.]